MDIFLKAALDLAGLGFEVFPLVPGKKMPLAGMHDYPTRATSAPGEIEMLWEIWPNANIAISTSRYRGGHLIAIDVDNKPGKNGFTTLELLKADGYDFPDTYSEATANGGVHLVYWSTVPMKNTVQILGKEYYGGERGRSAIDTRGLGGYLVAHGSSVPKGKYTAGVWREPAPAPLWVLEKFKRSPVDRTPVLGEMTTLIDAARATDRAVKYLAKLPPAPDGARNDCLYRAACVIKDEGVMPSDAVALMLEHWKCEPMLDLAEIESVIANAYAHGENRIGSRAPESLFKAQPAQTLAAPAEHASADPDVPSSPGEVEEATEEGSGPDALVAILNRTYAFATVGSSGVVLWETRDHEGRFKLRTLTIDSFRNKIAGEKLTTGDGERKEQYKIWLYHQHRRSCDGLVFAPGRDLDPRWYNLWRGFAYEPLERGSPGSREEQLAVGAYVEHLQENVAGGTEAYGRWLVSYFAHLVQKPWEKPLVALVLQGDKGVGKDATVNPVGALFPDHFVNTSKRRFLVGQFNSHLENCLMFVLNEAFWANDSAVEGILKGLVTERHHMIERKGLEPYSVDNLLRLVVMGNEDTLVPASFDERRWAVFKVGNKRKQDKPFFRLMRERLEAGGYRLLLRYLLDYDISGVDLDEAPKTVGLHEQKLAGQTPFHEWWLECLQEGRVLGSDFSDRWPERISKNTFRSAFRRWRKEREIRMKDPHGQLLGKMLKQCLPSIDPTQKVDGANAYILPALAQSRKEWDAFMKHPGEWN